MTDLKRSSQETALEYTRRVLKFGQRAKKSLGQNFLIDDQIIERIIQEGVPEGNLPVVEIGPGPGGLTRNLVERVPRLWAIELDPEKIELLRREFPDALTLLHGDALKMKLTDLWGSEKGWLVGNLPYYITNPLLMHFLEQKESLLGMTVMVQKEVADRITAQPGGKEYGILSIAIQVSAEVQRLFDVQPSAFWPQPKVTSTVLKLRIRPFPGLEVQEQALLKVAKAAFGQRRKTLLNTLSAGLGISKGEMADVLKGAGIENSLRAEDISILEYQQIVRALSGSSSYC